jgi:hypothetical protein
LYHCVNRTNMAQPTMVARAVRIGSNMALSGPVPTATSRWRMPGVPANGGLGCFKRDAEVLTWVHATQQGNAWIVTMPPCCSATAAQFTANANGSNPTRKRFDTSHGVYNSLGGPSQAVCYVAVARLGQLVTS